MTDDRPARALSGQLKLGILLDLLDEAATLLNDGAAAPTETLRAIYRDAVQQAIDRLREQPSGRPEA